MIGLRYKYRSLSLSLSLSSDVSAVHGTRCTTGGHLGGGSQYGSISEVVAGDRDDNFLVARCLDVFRPFGHGQRQMDGSSPPEVDYNVTILGIAALQSRVTNFRDDELSPTVNGRCSLFPAAFSPLCDQRAVSRFSIRNCWPDINRSTDLSIRSILCRLISVPRFYKSMLFVRVIFRFFFLFF